MPREQRLDLVHKATTDGKVRWKEACFKRFRDDPDLDGLTQKGVNQCLRDYVANGNSLKAREERDKDWLEAHPNDPWWYSAKLAFEGISFKVFVKVKLLWEEGDRDDEAIVEIVSIHRSL